MKISPRRLTISLCFDYTPSSFDDLEVVRSWVFQQSVLFRQTQNVNPHSPHMRIYLADVIDLMLSNDPLHAGIQTGPISVSRLAVR